MTVAKSKTPQPVTDLVADETWVPVSKAAPVMGRTRRQVLNLCANGSVRGVKSPAGWVLHPDDVIPMRQRAAPAVATANGNTAGNSLEVPSSGVNFAEFEMVSMRSEIAELRLRVELVTVERDNLRNELSLVREQSRRDLERAKAVAATQRDVIRSLSDAAVEVL